VIRQSEFSEAYLPVGTSTVLEAITPYSIAEIYKDRNEESSVYQSSQNLIDYLEEYIYIFKNSEEIKPFLISNSDLIQILLDAHEHIYRVFGWSPIYLELHHDPEEEWDELFIVIKTNYSSEKAIELENKLFEEWFIEIPCKVSGRLNFTEEPL